MRFAIQPFAAFKFLALALALLGVCSETVHADVVAIGDVIPAVNPEEDPEDPPSDELVPNLPQFGGEVEPFEIIIVGGTNQFVGDTSTGQLTIDIPSDTDPLISPGGIIGGSPLGLGQTRILGLNSEWRSTTWMIVGYQGQGFLDIAAGGRMQVVKNSTPDGAIFPNPQPTVQSPQDQWDLVLGAYEGSQGYAEIDGFASLVYSGNLSVGYRGQGHIEMLNGSRMITRNDASIGTAFNISGPNGSAIGTGYVLVDGPGTRWNIGIEQTQGGNIPPLPGGGPNPPNDTHLGDLSIGELGRGTLEVRNQGWVRVETDTVIGEVAGSYGRASVSGSDSLLWSLDDMVVGGAGTGQLQISDYGLVRADGDSATTGGVAIGLLGLVDFATNGQLVTPTVVNDGVIRGSGRVESLSVENNGDIRNAASIANTRERLVFTGIVNNTSNVESIGGEIEFQGDFNHTGPEADLVGVDAIFRFQGGLNVTGDARVYLENTVVWVPAGESLASDGLMSLWEGQSTLAGNLELGSGSELNIVLGEPDFGRLEVIGDATLAGGAFVSLADDYLPQIGDSFEIIDAESLSGTFSTVGGGGSGSGFWQASYTGTSAILTYMGDIISTLLADFDGNGIVDGADLAVLEMNYGKTPATMGDGDANGDGVVDGSDFLIWQGEQGSEAVVAAGAPAGGTVPEPSGLALAAVALGALARLRTGATAAGRGRRAA